jgi:hypothetical protein
MYLNDELFLAYKIGNSEIFNFPFPHTYIKNIFPDHIYNLIQDNMPEPEKLKAISEVRGVKGYDERFVLSFENESLAILDDIKKSFWIKFRDQLLSGNFKNFLLSRFLPFIQARFKNIEQIKFYDELLLVKDTMNYKLGPHTDAKRKVLTLLFYLPKNNSQQNLGTSIYMPKNLNFKCEGGPHYPHEDFEKIITMPFIPNSLFCFVKTENSFHGVEKINSVEKRWLLLYDIYIDEKNSINNSNASNKFSF